MTKILGPTFPVSSTYNRVITYYMKKKRTAGVDDEDLGGGDAQGQVRDLVGVAVAKAGVEGVPGGRKERADVLQRSDLELVRPPQHLHRILWHFLGSLKRINFWN